MALVQPVEKAVTTIGTKLGLTLQYEELCQHKSVIQAALKSIADHGRAHGLNKFEIPSKIALCTDLWTPDSGLVTAAFKIKRKEIVTKYKKEISELYV